MSAPKRPIKRVVVTCWRPNEYTSWRPRREHPMWGYEFTWGCFRVVVER